MSEEFKCGWRPEPASDKDFSFESAVGALLQKELGECVDLRQWCSPVENQLSLQSCSGNAVVGGLELLENERGDEFIELARLFPYYNGRAAIGETEKDEGCYIRDVMNSLCAFGVCPEAVWPYDVEKVKIRPSWKAYRAAYAHRIKSFYKIFETGDELIERIKSALRCRHPVVFGAMVYEAFPYYKSGRVAMPAGKCLGGHAMLIVGFDDVAKTFIVRNSWGPGWGEGGYCHMPYEYLAAAQANDFWVPTLQIERAE